jgi:hypothetical protein
VYVDSAEQKPLVLAAVLLPGNCQIVPNTKKYKNWKSENKDNKNNTHKKGSGNGGSEIYYILLQQKSVSGGFEVCNSVAARPSKCKLQRR